MASGLMFKSVIHVALIFVNGIRKGSATFFCMWLSGFSNTIFKRDYHLFLDYSWLPCQTLVYHMCEGLLGAVSSIRLICVYIFMSVPYCFG